MYDLYTYLWDMCCVIQTLDGFVQWVYKGKFKYKPYLPFHVRNLAERTWVGDSLETPIAPGMSSDTDAAYRRVVCVSWL